MKISGSFIMMLLVWLLGFTHFLGGPYWLFKAIFWIALLPYIIATVFFIWMLLKARSLLRSRKNIENNSTIHVDSEVKE